MNEGGLWKRSVSLCESSTRGTWREGSLLGTPKDLLSKALGMGVCFHRGLVMGNTEGRCFPRAFDRGV